MALEIKLQRGSERLECTVEPNAPLLSQLLTQGILLNYSCMRGDCGQCEVELFEGAVKPFEADRPCISRSKSVLLCNAVAQSDLTINVPYLQELANIRQLKSPAKIQALGALSENVMEVSLRLPPSVQFVFLAGQFIRVTNGEKTTRSYSLAAPVSGDKLLRLQIRRVEGGAFSDWLFCRAKVGELLYIEGPYGKFFFRDVGEFSKSIFLATGTGIAPIYSILAALTPDQLRRAGGIYVYWGNRCRADAYLADNLARLVDRLDGKLTFVFSAESASSEGRHVQNYLPREHADLSAAQVFAAGNTLMTTAAAELCDGLGLPKHCYHSDPFTVS